MDIRGSEQPMSPLSVPFYHFVAHIKRKRDIKKERERGNKSKRFN